MGFVLALLLCGCEDPQADPNVASDAERVAPHVGRPLIAAAPPAHLRRTWCEVSWEVSGAAWTDVLGYDALGRIVYAETRDGRQIRRWERPLAPEASETVVVRIWGIDPDRHLVAEGSPVTERYADGHIVTRQTTWGDITEDESWTWDAAGRPTSYSAKDGSEISLGWDDSGHFTGFLDQSSWRSSMTSEHYSWEGDRLVFRVRSDQSDGGTSLQNLTWTTHDDDGRPLTGEGWAISSGESTTESEWTEEWVWDEVGRAVSHTSRYGTGTWTWGDHELLGVNGDWYWDDAGRMVLLVRGTDEQEWVWADDGALRQHRTTTKSGTNVVTWSPGCPEAVWADHVVDVPNPGPWPIPPEIPGPIGAYP